MGASVIPHILRRSLRSLWENLYLNTVATCVIASALMLVGVYLVVQYNLNGILDSWDRDVHVSAYFHADVIEERRFALRDEVAGREEVARVRYVSESDASRWLLEAIPDLGEVLVELGPNALPASLEITLHEGQMGPEQIGAVVAGIQTSDFEEIDYGQQWLQKFNAFLSLLKLMGVVMGLLILISALFLVTNTVYLIVYNRRDELEIQKLVGATVSYIISPFLLEGLFHGVAGAVLAFAGLITLHSLVVVRLQEALQLGAAGELQFLPLPWLLILGLIGVVLGCGSALVAVTRFLSSAP